MDHFTVLIGLIGIMFASIIGVYVWTFKVSSSTQESLGNIFKAMNGHIQKADIHADKKEFVPAEVCAALHGALKEDITEIKKDVKTLLSK